VTVLSAQLFKDNAEIIEAMFKLKHLRPGFRILDPTFGQGNWWTRVRPRRLVTHDLAIDGVDFRKLPHRANSFGAVAFDPPYVSPGGRESTNIKKMYDAYGMTGAPTSPEKLQQLINDGLAEMYRVVRPSRLDSREEPSGGIVLVKCMSYVSSGHLWLGEFETIKAAHELGFEVVDQIRHVRKSGGPQPGGRTKKLKTGRVVKTRQMHAANNCSTLLVLRKSG
jgi:hypothetical protein